MIEYWKNLSLENLFYIDENGVVCEEEFRDIPDYEGYYKVSDLGRVKSCGREIKYKTHKKIFKEKMLSLCPDSRGYISVILYKDKNPRTLRIHVMVAMAFLGHVPCGHHVVADHIKEGNKSDNRLSNIQVITQRENSSKCQKNDDVGFSYRKEHKTPYEAKIRLQKTRVCLGSYFTKEEAVAVYQKAIENQHLFDGDKSKFKKLLGIDKRGAKLTGTKVLAIRRLFRIKPEFSRIGLSKKLGVSTDVVTKIIHNKTWKLAS